MSAPISVMPVYYQQFQITFGQAGIGSGFKGSVVKVDETNYSLASLPASFWWNDGSIHSFAFQSPLPVPANAQQYGWANMTGLSTLQNGITAASKSGNMTANYESTPIIPEFASQALPIVLIITILAASLAATAKRPKKPKGKKRARFIPLQHSLSKKNSQECWSLEVSRFHWPIPLGSV